MDSVGSPGLAWALQCLVLWQWEPYFHSGWLIWRSRQRNDVEVMSSSFHGTFKGAMKAITYDFSDTLRIRSTIHNASRCCCSGSTFC